MAARRAIDSSTGSGDDGWLARWVGFVGRWPYATLAIAVALVLGAVWLAAERLEFRGDRNDLIAHDIPWNRDFLGWYEKFAGATDVFVVVDAGDDRAAAEQAVHRLGGLLSDEPRVAEVAWGAAESEFSPHAARLAPPSEYRVLAETAVDGAGALWPGTVGGLLGDVVARLVGAGDERGAAAGIAQLADLVDWVSAGLAGTDLAPCPLVAPDAGAGWSFLEAPSGRFLLVRVSPRAASDGVHIFEGSLNSIRAIVARVQAEHPGLEIGVTGADAIEVDETHAILRDATLSSIIAFVAITILIVAFARSLLLPAVLVITLLIGLSWSFGWLVLSVGHLQLLSVVFLVILLGLGIDFGIHLTSCVRVHIDEPDPMRRLALGVSGAAGGIIAGGLTTAAAFIALSVTEFKGMAELGIIAGGGLLLCLLATFVVLPALIVVMDRAGLRWIRPLRPAPAWIVRPARHFERHPRLVWISSIAVILVLCVPALRVTFDYDLIRLQPEGLESTRWHERLMDEGGASAWYAVSVTDDLDEARALTERYRGLPGVGSMGGVATLFPPYEQENREIARAASVRLADAIEAEDADRDDGTRLASALASLQRALTTLGARGEIPAQIAIELERLRSSVDRAVTSLRALTIDERETATARLDAAYRAARALALDQIEALLDDRAVVPSDLPAAFRAFFVSEDDPDHPRYAVEIHPRVPEGRAERSVLARPFVTEFEAALLDVDPHVTGVLLQIARSGDLIKRAFAQAGIVAVAVVFVLLVIALRSFLAAALCLVPPTAGFLASLSWLTLTGGALDAANIIALPLLFGIAVDAGVHMVTRARHAPERHPLGLAEGTGWSITLTMLTTMLGFGALLIARHRGLRSLGGLMTVGLATSLVTCLLVMPGLLAMLRLPEKQPRRSEPAVNDPA